MTHVTHVNPFAVTAAFTMPRDATIEQLSELRTRIKRALVDGGAKYVILDFADAGYVSTNALGQTVAIHRAVAESLAELILCGMHGDARAAMTKAKLDHLVEHVTDYAAAWALVRERLRAKVTRGCAALAQELAAAPPPTTQSENK